jgi:hypothetical protein
MADPREDFIARIDVSKTRVRSFDGFILLCGGLQGVDPVPIKSIRHMIYHELTSGRHSDMGGRLKLAEDIKDWFRDGNYRDLVTFEEHLAGLSAVIVLVVESAGAIAELGAFSVSEAFADRLLVLVAEIHYDTESFIRLGPIRRLENNHDNSVLVYDWHDRTIFGRVIERFDKIQGELPAIIDAIRGFIDPKVSESKFKLNEPAHVMFLICELCDLFGALPYKEIHEYIGALRIILSGDDLKRYLFLLEKCDILRIKASGHGRYYYPIGWSSRISFGFFAGAPIDRDRLRVQVAEFYEREITSRYEVVKKIERA